jgi:protein TonB
LNDVWPIRILDRNRSRGHDEPVVPDAGAHRDRQTGTDQTQGPGQAGVRARKRNEALNTEDFTPEKPPKPPETPPETPPQDMDNIDPSAPTINVAPPTVSAETSIGGPGGMNIAEGDYLPIVRVAPVYPARALSRGLEGYVDMAFTVTTTGTVKDPVVVFSTSSLFERAAIRAVLKFKYKPRVVDGVPVEVPNVKTRITFKIEE